MDALINTNSVKDCHWIGKYNTHLDHPRPLLVNFLRNIDTSSNKTKLASQIYVKPDLTTDERTIGSLLLKRENH